MIKTILIENFKCFNRFELRLDRINLLVGSNNSGKTTVFHALQLIFWCINQIANESGESITLGKTQVTEIPVVPYDQLRDIFHKQRIRSGRMPTHLKLTVEATDLPLITIEIYQAYSRNFMVTGNDLVLTKGQFEQIQALNPLFIPGTIGITTKEEFYRPISLDTLIRGGRQNQVLRNLVYQLRESSTDWSEFVQTLKPLFALEGIDVPFDSEHDLWMTAVYEENECRLDFVSAGAGFLQFVNLLTFLFRYKTRVAMLDEPDSHMHEDLLRLAFDLLDKLSAKRNLQLIIATHSPVLIDAAGLNSVLLIDKASQTPLRAQNVESLIPLLTDRGLSLPPSKVMDTLRCRRVLFVEGEEKDYEKFIVAFGDVVQPGFRAMVRGLSVFEIGEGRKDWPFDAIDAFQKLIGVSLTYLYLADRDFLLESEVRRREERASREGQKIRHLTRRNRECYLLDPPVISRLLRLKWQNKECPFPVELEELGIRATIIDLANSEGGNCQTALLVENEPLLRGSSEHRTQKTQEVLAYFQQCHIEPLTRGEIPYELLDGKLILKRLRRRIADTHGVHFQDVEIIRAFKPEEVPQEIVDIVNGLLAMFPNPGEMSGTSEATAAQSDNKSEMPLFVGLEEIPLH